MGSAYKMLNNDKRCVGKHFKTILLELFSISSSSSTQDKILQEIENLNADPFVHGIIVQMPLDSHEGIEINSHLVTNRIDPDKDVDSLTTINQGKVATGVLNSFMPCTPAGCLDLIKQSGVKLEGANAVVIGRSKIVGTPVTQLLKWNDATVTTCHSKTQNLKGIVSQADILVVAIGQPQFIPGSWIKTGAVVIDAGINFIPDSYKKSGK